MADARADNMLPGVQGKDYRLVKYGGNVYAVYTIEVNGKKIPISWRIDKADYEVFGVDPGKLGSISKQQFGGLQVMGNADEIKRRGEDVHPWVTYVKKLKDLYGDVPWLNNREFMGTMLEGWFEGWSDVELQQALKTTDWYQNRTDQQRKWLLDTSEAERQAQTESVRTQLLNQVEAMLGPQFDARKLLKDKELDDLSLKIASGKWGAVSEGMSIAISKLQRKAERIEGSQAWIDKQTQIESQNAFANRPEDTLYQLQKDVDVWLGPNGSPSKDVLTRWAGDLVTGKASQSDWQTFLQRQASALYPFLSEGETWQDRASSYKQIAEREWGRPVNWDAQILNQIGAKDPTSGAFTGQALPYDEFQRLLRSKNEWWQGPVARDQGYQLVNYMNNVFNGVS